MDGGIYMKKRNLIKTSLLAGTLLLGTGYAVINNRVLTATGTVPIAQKNLDVKIVDTSGFDSATIINNGLGLTFTLPSIMENPPLDNSNPLLTYIYVSIENKETDLDVTVSYTATVTDNQGNDVPVEIGLEAMVEEAGGMAMDYIPAGDIGVMYHGIWLESGYNYLQHEELNVTITYTVSPKL
jgi:hypothetical protein